MVKALDIWLPAYLSHRRRAPRREELTDLMVCICDHFEPMHHTDRSGALTRLERWKREYPQVAASAVDADGFAPRHTFFYPIEQYAPELLEPLEPLCREHGCEVEVHLHHDRDTPENLRAELAKGLHNLRQHGFLANGADGKPIFAFIHGNWALDHSHPEGKGCGVTGELALLKEAGCYGDFTMPSAPNRCQTRTVNSLYYAKSGHTRKSHDTGILVCSGETAHLREAKDHLLLIQGPLGLNWRWRKWGILPRIENADLTGGNPPTATRLALWLDLPIHVEGCPQWRFLKLHTHGAIERNAGTLLGEPMKAFHRLLAERARTDGFRVHYVTARELVNILHAAEAGKRGNAGDYRNFIHQPPPLTGSARSPHHPSSYP